MVHHLMGMQTLLLARQRLCLHPSWMQRLPPKVAMLLDHITVGYCMQHPAFQGVYKYLRSPAAQALHGLGGSVLKPHQLVGVCKTEASLPVPVVNAYFHLLSSNSVVEGVAWYNSQLWQHIVLLRMHQALKVALTLQLSEQRAIVLPVPLEAGHWLLGVICMPSKCICGIDPAGSSTEATTQAVQVGLALRSWLARALGKGKHDLESHMVDWAVQYQLKAVKSVLQVVLNGQASISPATVGVDGGSQSGQSLTTPDCAKLFFGAQSHAATGLYVCLMARAIFSGQWQQVSTLHRALDDSLS